MKEVQTYAGSCCDDQEMTRIRLFFARLELRLLFFSSSQDGMVRFSSLIEKKHLGELH